MTMTSSVGTPFYMAPEMAKGLKHYTCAVDVYSFAIMAAQVMLGKLVYDTEVDYSTQYSLLMWHIAFVLCGCFFMFRLLDIRFYECCM